MEERVLPIRLELLPLCATIDDLSAQIVRDSATIIDVRQIARHANTL